MNKKGYMLYELIIAFVLTTIICIFLLSTAFKLNDKNQELTISAKMNVIQEDFTARFYNDANSRYSVYFIGAMSDANGEYCTFLMDDDTINIGIDKTNNTIYYDDYETELPDGIEVKRINCESTYNGSGFDTSIFHNIKEGNKNSAVAINIMIEDTFTNKEYDINILYLYQDMEINYAR